MTDFRIAIGFFNHPKTVKLQRRLGSDGVLSLIRLFEFCAINKDRCSGSFEGMSNEDIAIAAQWDGDEEEFVKTLESIRFFDKDKQWYKLRNFEEHNPWVAGSKDRSKSGSAAALIKHHKLGRHAKKHEKCPLCQASNEDENPADSCGSHAGRRKNPAGRRKNPAGRRNPDSPNSNSNSNSNTILIAQTPSGVVSPKTDFAFEIPVKCKAGENKTAGITREQVDEWQETFPAVDVPKAIKKLIVWSNSNPAKKKTPRGVTRFIFAWLEREHNGGRYNRDPHTPVQPRDGFLFENRHGKMIYENTPTSQLSDAEQEKRRRMLDERRAARDV